MKNNFFNLFLLCVCALFTPNVHAQTASSDEAVLKTFWKDIWDAYEAGDSEKMWAAYTDEAAEISPDGHLTQGKKALREGWDAFMKMVDTRPKFTYETPSVRILSPEFAILTWTSTADIKIQGQQIGGKTTGVAFVRKIKGRWMIELDALIPVMEMPAPAGGGN